MRCYGCHNDTVTNVLMACTELQADQVVTHFGTIAIRDGEPDMFMPDDGSAYAGLVIICEECAAEATAAWFMDQVGPE